MRASWLRRAAAEGTIACTFVGKHLRFSDADLAAIIAHGARGPRPEHDAEPAAPPAAKHART